MNDINTSDLNEVNVNYKKGKSKWVKFLDFLFYTFLILAIGYLIFCLNFVQAQVIGPSMQPTFNKNLSYYEDAETSIYQDIVYVNKLDSGKNGDVILADVGGEVIIKRIIATEGQTVVLKKQSDGYFYYLVGNSYEQAQLIDESYILDRQDMNLNYFNNFCIDDPDLVNRKNVTVVDSDREAYLVVPKNCVFILGDNRLVSKDSTSFGCVNRDKVIGAVAFSYEYNQTLFGFIWQQICSIF